jgi:tricorn protease
MNRRIFLTLLGSFLLINVVSAQGTRLLRQPTISSKNIVFVYADDLWLVDREGGDAKRLTSHEGTESFPHFSPDGSKVAFSAQYDGNTDVFVVNTEGGEPKRLTYHPDSDVVQGWTPDGKILFRSGRDGVPTKINHFFTINTDGTSRDNREGGNESKLPIPQASFGDMSDDGNFVAYTPITFWDPEWRNYRGGQAQPIWIMNMKDNTLIQTPQTDRERHTDPVWFKGEVYFLSERDYANNVWKFNPKTKDLKQISFHKDFDCKSIDACGDRIVYEQAGFLHSLDPATNKAKQLIINVKGDFNSARPRWKDVTGNDLTNASLSPTGQRAVFEYRGDIFTIPKENGDGRNITNTSGVADRSPVWSPDGKKIAWFSDASGEYQLMIADQMGMEKPRAISFQKPTFFFKPVWSSDGKYLSFSDTDYTIWVVDVAAGTTKKVDSDRMAHPNRTMNPSFSTDSKWIAYVKILENQFKAVHLYNIETGVKTQITDGLADAIDPVWDASGKYLYFLASTDYGVSAAWLDMSSYDLQVTRGLYVVVLNKKDSSPLLPKSDEEEGNGDKKEAKDSSKTTVIDLEGISQRILSVNIPLRNYTALMAGPKDYVFYTENVPNQQGVTLHRYNFKDKKAEVFLTPVNFATTSHDRKQLLYQSKDTWGIVKTDGTPKIGDGKLTIDLKTKIVPQEEWAQILKEGWRYMRDFLYVDNVHGAPWKQVYEWYSPWVKDCRHRTDLNYIVDILSGEVAVGHSYVSGGDFPDVKRINVGLLGADIAVENGGFRVKKIYTGENWNPDLKAPLSVPGVDVKVGDYIAAVNGVPLNTANNFYSYFENKADKQVKISVNSTAITEGSRLVTVVPITDEGGLRSRDWVEGNRRKVDSLSKGQLAYVYIPNTGRPGYNYFNRYYFSQMDKKGAVIDERNNGGGSAADYIVDVLARKLHGYFNSRVEGHKPFTVPDGAIWGPKVMIINERAGSGGDLMPYLFKEKKVGPLVGVRTWGGLVGTWDTPPFIDRGRMVAPRGGFYDVNGKWAIEGEGIAPDIEVAQNPAEVLKGNDPQLERAVQEALKLMNTEGVPMKPEPVAPIRYKRPN